MNVGGWFIPLIALWVGVGCTVSSPPTPTPSPMPAPSPTLILEPPTGLLPTPVGNRRAPADVPACKDAQNLEKPVEFAWAGIEDVVQSAPESNWTFYRCSESQSSLSAFYRQWMPGLQNQWTQFHWEERANATLGVYYFSTSTPGVPNRWLYLWFLPDSSTQQTAYLVAAWWQVPKSC